MNRWLTVLGAAAVGTYAASRLRSRPRNETALGAERGSAAATNESPGALRVPMTVTDPQRFEPAERVEPAASPVDAPTGAVAMVVAKVEPTAAAPALRWLDHNGSSPSSSETTEATVRERGTEPVELPRARRPSGATLAGLAALAGFAAIALGAWALESGAGSNGSAAGGSARIAEAEQVISLLSKPSTQRIPLAGSAGRIILVVGASGRSVLVLDDLEPALAGKAYQAWVVDPTEKAPISAAVFSGTERAVPLSELVEPGSAVGVTVERAGGVPAPTRSFTLVARPDI